MSSLKYFIGTIAVTASMVTPGIANATTTTTNCLDGTKASSYVTSFTHGTGTISTKNGAALCQNVNLVLESWNVPDTWNRVNFNSTAIPQTKYAVNNFTMPAGQKNVKKTLTVNTPADCKNTQLDFYFAPGYEKITTLTMDNERYIGGALFKGVGTCATPTPTPSKTPSPTPTPSKTPSPTPTPSATPTPSPTPSATPSPSPTPIPRETPQVLGAGEAAPVLPDTGAEGLSAAFGLTALVGTTGIYLKQRLNRK